jgi:hypothetical protein
VPGPEVLLLFPSIKLWTSVVSAWTTERVDTASDTKESSDHLTATSISQKAPLLPK